MRFAGRAAPAARGQRGRSGRRRPAVLAFEPVVERPPKQPNSDQCFVCGINSPVGLRLVFEDDGESVVQSRFEIPTSLQGYPAIAHGGVVAAALDEAMGRVAMIKRPNRFTMTVRMELKYRAPACPAPRR